MCVCVCLSVASQLPNGWSYLHAVLFLLESWFNRNGFLAKFDEGKVNRFADTGFLRVEVSGVIRFCLQITCHVRVLHGNIR